MRTKKQWDTLFAELGVLKESISSKIDKVLEDKEKYYALENENNECEKAYWCLEEALSCIWNSMCDNFPAAIMQVDRDWYDKWTTEYLEWYENAKEKIILKIGGVKMTVILALVALWGFGMGYVVASVSLLKEREDDFLDALGL